MYVCMSSYYCKSKQCTCKSLHYRFTQGRCDDCAHSAMQHYCHFNKHILNPIKRCGYVGDGRKAMLKVYQQIYIVCTYVIYMYVLMYVL